MELQPCAGPSHSSATGATSSRPNNHGAVGWKILTERGEGKPYALSPLVGLHGLTLCMLQTGMVDGFHGMTMHLIAAGRSEEVHAHPDKEQVYYFTEKRGKLALGDETVDVRDGDADYISPGTPHHLILSTLIQS